LLGTKTPLPPLAEQKAIVRFFRWASGRLDRAIQAKRKVIALLNEQKQAIIHRTVTQGLDPNAQLKASGVHWLGDVPVHWEVRRMRASVTDCVNGIWGSDPDGESDITCVRVADFDRKNLRVSLQRKTIRSISSSARSRRLLQRGDLLLEKSGGGDKQPVGAVVIYNHDEPAVCSNFVARLSIHEGYEPKFVNYLFSALYACRVNVPSIKQTTGIQNLDSKSYLAERAGFPSKIEQQKIAAYLDKACQGFATAIEKLENEIQLLTEYRIRLVADIVTGKLDVREVAVKLPEDVSHDATADMGIEEDTDNLDQEAIE
jgi:type I restriction enzyme S subunit